MQNKLIEKKAKIEAEIKQLVKAGQQHSQAINSINASLMELNGQLKLVDEFLNEDKKDEKLFE